MKARIFIKGDSVVISGVVATDVDISIFRSPKRERAFEPIKNRGMNGSLWKKSWDELDAIAKAIGTVTYSK